MRARRLRASMLVFSVLLLFGGILTFSAMWEPQQACVPTETVSMNKTVNQSFVLSSSEPSYTMSFENSTENVEVLSLYSNGTAVQIVAYAFSGTFLKMINVSKIEGIALGMNRARNITFSRQTGDANVTVTLFVSYRDVIVSWRFLNWALRLGVGVLALGASIWWFHTLKRHRTQHAGLAVSPKNPAKVVALMLLSALCFTPVVVVIGIYGRTFCFDANWIGNGDTVTMELNTTHPQEQVEIRPFGGYPALVDVMDFVGGSVLLRFQTGATSEEFIAETTSQEDWVLHVELRNDTVITLARVNDNVTLTLWWYSGTWIIGCSPSWLMLLSPLVGIPAIIGLILVVSGLDEAKRIDSEDTS